MEKFFNTGPKLKLIMKLLGVPIVIVLVLATLGVAKDGNAQDLMKRTVTFHVADKEIVKVLTTIGHKTNVKFTYLPGIFPAEAKVSAKFKNEPLENVLRALLEPYHVGYQTNGEFIILRKMSAPQKGGVQDLKVVVPQISQDITVTGKVTDDKGGALPGVSIILKGTQRGTVTNVEGEFSFNVPDKGSVLVFSYVGYLQREVVIANQTSLAIQLLSDNKTLEEVVVVGYGTVKKSDLTGAVSKVGESDIKATPIVALDRALQGRVAGVHVTTNSAQPGGSTTVRIRGTGSVNAGNEPLYVIDGYPTGNLNSINPSDIESIDILKDASATAIYGSRGSNGVVIVTTKRGKEGQSSVNFESYYGVQSVRRKIPLMNAREYAEFINDTRVNGGSAPYFDGSTADRPLPSTLGEGTDWQDEVLRQAPIRNYQLSFTGGETKTRYAISGSYYDQQGILKNSYFKRYTLRANLDRDVKSWLKVGLSMQGAYTKSNASRTETDGGINSGVTTSAINYAPVFPIYNSAGTYYLDQGSLNGNLVDNPVGLVNEITDQNLNVRLLGNLFADIKLAEGLVFRTSWGSDILNTKSNYYATRLVRLGATSNGSATINSGFSLNWLNENTLSYTRDFGQKHNLNALVGYTTQGYHNEGVTANAINFTDDFAKFNNLAAGATLQTPGSSASDWALISYLARVNYNFDSRFLVTLTARSDGSSRFGPNNKYGFFPSGAIAWRVINEKFLRNQEVITDLKLRTSYGLSGNQAIGDYQYLSGLGVSTSVLGGSTPVLRTGWTPTALNNQDLRWEKNAQFDVGVDVGFLNNRLQFTADYYIKTTSDLLFSVNVPQTTGYSTALRNIGKVENRGLELSLSSVNVDKRDFRWNTEFSVALNRNKILTLDGRPEFTTGSGIGHLQVSNTVLLKVGEPLGNFYGRVMEGIFQNQGEIDNSAQKTAKPGDIRYKDINNDGVINDNDRTIIGNGYPKLFGGLNNTITYKGFELNIFFQGVAGNEILNYLRFDLYNLNGNNNQAKEVVNRWTSTNPSNEIPRATIAGGQRILSTFHIEDGAYLRLKNLSLGYNLPSALIKRIAVRNVKVYAAAQNYLTLTRYKGYDPEVSRFGTTSISQGMDYGGYPAAKTLLFGLNVTL